MNSQLSNAEIMEMWMNDQKIIISKGPTKIERLVGIKDKNKIPLSAEDFIEWLMNFKWDITFIVFYKKFKVYILMNQKLTRLRVEIVNLYSYLRELNTGRVTIVNVGIDDRLVEKLHNRRLRVMDINNTTGDIYERSIRIWKVLEVACDESLRDNYIIEEERNINQIFALRRKNLEEELQNINSVLNIYSDIYKIYIEWNLPNDVTDNGIESEIKISLPYKHTLNFPETNWKSLIKDHLYPYLDLAKYVINILDVKKVEKIWVPGEHYSYIYIIINTELIKNDIYYETIGWYRARWENSCINRRIPSDIKELAVELNVDVNDYTNIDELCQEVHDIVMDLRWSDVEL